MLVKKIASQSRVKKMAPFALALCFCGSALLLCQMALIETQTKPPSIIAPHHLTTVEILHKAMQKHVGHLLGIDWNYFDAFDFDNIDVSNLKFLFLHVGKTGGASLKRALHTQCRKCANIYARRACFEKVLGYVENFQLNKCDKKQKGTERTQCLKTVLLSSANENPQQQPDELLLSRVTNITLHAEQPRLFYPPSTYNALLWSIRNPINRAISAFDMSHPSNRKGGDSLDVRIFYQLCNFSTAQILADVLESDNSISNNDNRRNATTGIADTSVPRMITVSKNKKKGEMMDVDCHKYGRDTLEGNGAKNHLFFNFARYRNYTKYHLLPRQPPIYVLRTEKLWEDVIQTNGLLTLALEAAKQANASPSPLPNDGKGPPSAPQSWIAAVRNISSYRYTHGSEKYAFRSRLNGRGREIFCCYLADEVAIYEDLVVSAINLSDRQKMETLREVYEDCGIESRSGIGRFQWKEWRSSGCPRAEPSRLRNLFEPKKPAVPLS